MQFVMFADHKQVDIITLQLYPDSLSHDSLLSQIYHAPFLSAEYNPNE